MDWGWLPALKEVLPRLLHALQSWKFYATVLLASAILLVMSYLTRTHVLETSGLEQVLPARRPYLIILIVVSSSVLAMMSISRLIDRRQRLHRERAGRATMERIVDSLDDKERAVLREYWIQSLNTIVMLLDDPPVAGLRRKGVLAVVSAEPGVNVYGQMWCQLAVADTAKDAISRLSDIQIPLGDDTCLTMPNTLVPQVPRRLADVDPMIYIGSYIARNRPRWARE